MIQSPRMLNHLCSRKIKPLT